jgi:putative ABC transport system permease protein
MNRHYVNAALHSLSRNPVYTVISLLGLAVAFASLLLIGAYVRTELTHDRWVPDYENVYRLHKRFSYRGNELASDTGGPAEGLWLKQDIPEVEAVARLRSRMQKLSSGDVEIFSPVVWADPEIFRVLPLPVMAGDQGSALESADSLVVSRALARRLLGAEQVVGKTVDVDGEPMRITAVLDAPPGPSHLSIDALASGNSQRSGLAVQGGGSADWDSVHTYLRVAPGSIHRVREALPALIDRHVSPSEFRGMPPPERASSVFSYALQPLASLHMEPYRVVGVAPSEMVQPTGNLSLVLALSAIALLILLLAMANFVNIMWVRATQRAVEVGMRKVIGASRWQLVGQFVGESTALAAVGAVIGILIGLLCLPGFGAYVGRDLPPSFLADPALAGGLLLALLLVGVVGGIYPGIVLSSLRPSQILRGPATHAGGVGTLRHALVIFQFAMVIGLVVAVLVISTQVSYLVQKSSGVDSGQLLYVDAGDRCNALKEPVGALPGTLGAACAEKFLLGLDGARVVPASLPDGTPFTFHVLEVGPDALELLGVRLLAGRFPAYLTANPDPPRDGGLDSNGVLVNYAAVRGLGFSSPEAAVGQQAAVVGFGRPQITGVVEDFPSRSLRSAAGPVVFRPGGYAFLLVVKLRGDAIPQTMRDIEQIWKASGPTGPFKAQFHDQYAQRLYEDIAHMKQLCMAFSIIAAFIAAMGIYGLSALAVEHGATGVGVRKTFGARRADILQLLLWRFSAPILAASLLAWPLSYWIMRRWLEGFAHHIDLGPGIFLAASASALVVALAAVIGHALQLSRLRPVVALRHR